MKQFIVVAVLCVIVYVQALTDEQKAKVKVASEKCVGETGVDPKLVAQGRQGEFVDDPKLKQFILCFLKATEILDDNADVRADKVKEKLSKDVSEAELDGLLTKCKPAGSDPVEKASG
ncbi:hypothetical protein AMK59_3534, partial [Oryctes borbonicus]